MEELGRKEQSNHLQFAKLILKVLYSPFRAFEEIVKEPNIKGPLLILLITLPITFAIQQISSTKFFIETPMPGHDEWTEKPSGSNSLLWISNGNLSFDSTDHISGNYSVSASSVNSMEIWMRLTGIHVLNIVDEDYSRLSISVKFTSEPSTRPETVLLQLFSYEDQSSGFNINIEPLLEATVGDWSNITVNLMTEEWATMDNEVSWDNITEIGCLFTWVDSANITVGIDQLYLGRYIPFSSATTLYSHIGSIFRSVVDFLVGWLILSGLVLLVLKGLSGWGGSWRKLLSTMGYTYSSSIVYLIVLMLLFFFLPSIFIPYDIEAWRATEIYQESWGNPISILSLIFYGWATVLCGVALKKIADLSWAKALFIGLGAVMLSLLFSSFLLSALFIIG